MNSDKILMELYEDLKTNIMLNRKLINGSILLPFLETKSNTQLGYLYDSSKCLRRFTKNAYQELIRNELIREGVDEGCYHITAKGIWQIENEKVLSTNDLIEYIDNRNFVNRTLKKKMTNKEKVIILSFIIARAFSEEYSIKLKTGDYVLDACKNIIDFSNESLSKMKALSKLSRDALYGKKGNEHMVSNLIRHTDSLPKKTKLIFKALGKQQYYLNISENGQINEERLKYLFDSIFEGVQAIEYAYVIDLYEELNHFTYDTAYRIYDNIKCSFLHPKYDEVIKRCFIESLTELKG